jgi:alcohol dehydrogenase
MNIPEQYTVSDQPQTVVLREGAIRDTEELLDRLKAKNLFFVVDETAYEHSGAARALKSALKNRQVVRFSGFELNPKIEDAEKGISIFRDVKPDTVIALGGGSALDMAKAIAVCSVQNGRLQDYVTGEQTPQQPGPPLIAIPTTSGTGSEATHFAVMYMDGRKYSLAHPLLLPEYAIIDPELTLSLPSGITASSGLDALCQAVESIWAVGSTDESVNYALEALSLASDHLELAVNRPNPAARMAMARAAHLGGMWAEGSSRLTGLMPDAFMACCMAVATVPGLRPTTRMPELAYSLSAQRVSASTAALVAQ